MSFLETPRDWKELAMGRNGESGGRLCKLCTSMTSLIMEWVSDRGDRTPLLIAHPNGLGGERGEPQVGGGIGFTLLLIK